MLLSEHRIGYYYVVLLTSAPFMDEETEAQRVGRFGPNPTGDR